MYFGTKPGKINPGYLKAGLKNIWVSEADDPPFGAGSFALITDDPAELSKAFDFGNWCNGTAFIYRDTAAGTEAAFIEQGEANDEWLTMRAMADGTVCVFESISWRYIIRRGEPGQFECELAVIMNATDDEIKTWLQGGAEAAEARVEEMMR